ncbi:nucleotidyltransferase domain-containing protein [candidate division KSB1 bacterium]|nr:nucleotidyltransferase domain-containing protein [candidate division KSB1 bacterium]
MKPTKTKDFYTERGQERQILEELVTNVVTTVHPLRIILFGSTARGEAGVNSDLDLLIIMPDGTHRRNTARILYRVLNRLGIPKDLVVVTESDLHTYSANPSLILASALAEGKELYCAAA